MGLRGVHTSNVDAGWKVSNFRVASRPTIRVRLVSWEIDEGHGAATAPEVHSKANETEAKSLTKENAIAVNA